MMILPLLSPDLPTTGSRRLLLIGRDEGEEEEEAAHVYPFLRHSRYVSAEERSTWEQLFCRALYVRYLHYVNITEV